MAANVAYGSNATEMGCPRDVRFPPDSDQTADMASGPVRAMNRHALLFNHLVGAGEDRRWDGEAQCLRGLEVDD
jgi:hypothetical protein